MDDPNYLAQFTAIYSESSQESEIPPLMSLQNYGKAFHIRGAISLTELHKAVGIMSS
jgi:hypothetical protein